MKHRSGDDQSFTSNLCYFHKLGEPMFNDLTYNDFCKQYYLEPWKLDPPFGSRSVVHMPHLDLTRPAAKDSETTASGAQGSDSHALSSCEDRRVFPASTSFHL